MSTHLPLPVFAFAFVVVFVVSGLVESGFAGFSAVAALLVLDEVGGSRWRFPEEPGVGPEDAVAGVLVGPVIDEELDLFGLRHRQCELGGGRRLGGRGWRRFPCRRRRPDEINPAQLLGRARRSRRPPRRWCTRRRGRRSGRTGSERPGRAHR